MLANSFYNPFNSTTALIRHGQSIDKKRLCTFKDMYSWMITAFMLKSTEWILNFSTGRLFRSAGRGKVSQRRAEPFWIVLWMENKWALFFSSSSSSSCHYNLLYVEQCQPYWENTYQLTN